MSASAVRTAFRTKLNGLLAPDGFTYVETINLATPSALLPNKYYTLDFPGSTERPISLGVPTLFREEGRCVVAILIPHQTQDTDAVDAAESVRDEMTHFVDATGMVRVLSAQPPTDMDGGDFLGAFYRVTVDLLYAFDRFA